MSVTSIICIGGSSGSIEVIHDILANLPCGFDVPIVIALHRHVSSQDTLLRLLRSDGMPALVEPFDKDPLSEGAVYLAPPDYHMMVEDGCISLSTDPPVHHARPSIDVLFESVACGFSKTAVGVILSGASEDGASGASSLHSSGGQVIVQDPVTAGAAALPLATLHSVPMARVLSVPQMIEELKSVLVPERQDHG